MPRPALRYRIGRYLLRHNRPEEAAPEFLTASALGFGPTASGKHPRKGRIADIRSPGALFESFDGGVQPLPLYPRLGGFRPDDEDRKDLAVWSANMDFFDDTSGVEPGMGVGGSRALVVRGVAGVVSSGFYVPLAVRPSKTYTVEFSMRSMMGEGGDAGAGVLEYDTILDKAGELSERLDRKHRSGGDDYIRIRGKRDWEKYSFTFRTSPGTRMAHILFFREGTHSRNPVIFDDITIHEAR